MGKNPVTHPGKLYNLLAHQIAHRLVEQFPEVTEAQCHLLSRIGRPISEPEVFDVAVRIDESKRSEHLLDRIGDAACRELLLVKSIWPEVIRGKLPLW